jgi:hypothetical protein
MGGTVRRSMGAWVHRRMGGTGLALALLLAASTAPSARQAGTLDLAYEKPALEALAKPKPPTAFPFDLVTFRVPVPGRTGLVAVNVQIPGGTLGYLGTKMGTFTAGAVVLARFVNAAGDVVAKESQEFSFTGLLSDAKATLSKPTVFSRLHNLEPGSYRLQVAVFDEGGTQASVVVQPFDVPPVAPVIVGDLMIVERAEKIDPAHPVDPSNPFVAGEYLLHPAFDPGVNRGLHPDVNFILPVVIKPGAFPPTMRLSLLAESGQALASVPLPIKAPEPDGKLFVLGRVPLAKVPPNKYTLQVAVGTFPDAIVRKSPLTVVD